MQETNEFNEIAKIILKDINKIGIETLPSTNDLYSINELKKYLTEQVTRLMDRDYDKLINTLYLIDLDETKLHELFSSQDRNSIASSLAEMIIERQIQKINFRKKYKESKI